MPFFVFVGTAYNYTPPSTNTATMGTSFSSLLVLFFSLSDGQKLFLYYRLRGLEPASNDEKSVAFFTVEGVEMEPVPNDSKKRGRLYIFLVIGHTTFHLSKTFFLSR